MVQIAKLNSALIYATINEAAEEEDVPRRFLFDKIKLDSDCWFYILEQQFLSVY